MDDYSAFTPQQPQQAPISQQWEGFLADPRGRAALASLGISLMQPVSPGQTGLGHVGQALGQAGESVRGTEALDLRQDEFNSKDALRTAQADNAAARAQTAETRAGFAGERLQRISEAERGRNERNRLSLILRAQGQYNKLIQDIQKRNTDPLRTPGTPVEAVPPFNQWLESNPMLRDALTVRGTGPSASETRDASHIPDANLPVDPPVPAPPTGSRIRGTVYSTPKGPLKWTGTGWIQP